MARAPKSERPFLTAEWRNLVMLNYEIDPNLLAHFVPRGTQVDTFESKTFVSLVGFSFANTKLYGRMPIPFHANFEEVNLRFYVRRNEGNELRRGVVFLAEIVPRHAVALLARLAYNENYLCYPMNMRYWCSTANQSFTYMWKRDETSYSLMASTYGAPHDLVSGSLEQFITEHYWGYAKQRDGGTMEYRVAHKPWHVWNAMNSNFSGDAGAFYGSEFQSILSSKPHSAFVAVGSPVEVFRGHRLPR